MRQGMRMGGGGGLSFTPLTKSLLTTLVALYIGQLVIGAPVAMGLLAWNPFGAGFQPWQPFTAFFLNGTPMRAFFDWLFLFFILPPVEQLFGRDKLFRFAVSTYLGSIVLGMVFLLTGMVHINNGVWFGIEPFLAGLLVIFGLSRPNAQILLFFVLPVRAAWVAWGSGLLCLLYLLSDRNLSSAMWAAGWISGFVWLRGGMQKTIKQQILRWKQRQLKQKLSRFDVIEGGQGWGSVSDDDNVH
jgi:membrane associated rhomboid family serine protease